MLKKKIKRAICAAMSGVMLSTTALSAGAATLGDTTGDGLINATDASAILTEYALASTNQPSQFTSEEKEAADVDKNGIINAIDATHVLSFYAYKSTNKKESAVSDIEDYIKNPPVTTTKATTTTTTTVTTTTTLAANLPPEAAPLIGKWASEPKHNDEDDEENEIDCLYFSPEGYVSLFYDASEEMIFRKDGFFYDEKLYPYDTIKWDGTDMEIPGEKEDEPLIQMKRVVKGDDYDGKYQIYGGELYEGFIFILLLAQVKDINETTLTAEFNGDHSEIWINNFIKYSVSGNQLTWILNSDAEGDTEDGDPIEFTVDGDTLTMKSKDETEILHRIK